MTTISMRSSLGLAPSLEMAWHKALSKVIRRTFGANTPIQRCQIHKARNVTERLPKSLHASVPGRSGRLGNSTMPTKLSGCCVISPAGSTSRRPASPPASLKGSMRC